MPAASRSVPPLGSALHHDGLATVSRGLVTSTPHLEPAHSTTVTFTSTPSAIPSERPRKRRKYHADPVSRQWRKLRRILGAPGFLISRRKALRPLPLPAAETASSDSDTIDGLSPAPSPLFGRSPSPSSAESSCIEPWPQPETLTQSKLGKRKRVIFDTDGTDDGDNDGEDTGAESLDSAQGFRQRPHSPTLPRNKGAERMKKEAISCYASSAAGGRGSGKVSKRNPFGFADRVVRMAPGMRRLSHFVLQEHHATAKHFDLRFSCYDPTNKVAPWGTYSFAIPKGLLDMEEGRWRLAIQTPRHSIAYSEFEGGHKKPVMMYDAGSYRWIPSNWSKARNDDLDPPTDAESDQDAIDLHEQSWFRRKHRQGFFTVELNGVRHKRLRLFFKRLDEVKYPRKKVPTKIIMPRRRRAEYVMRLPAENARTVAHCQWLVRLAVDENGETVNVENRTIGRRSIFSGLDMDEIRAYGRTAEGRRQFRRMLHYNRKHFGAHADGDPELLVDGFDVEDDALDLNHDLPAHMPVD